jgi:outer membrane protein
MRIMRNIMMLAFIAVSGFLLSSVSLAGEYKFGYVDIQRAVTESLAGKNAMKKFEEEVKGLEADILDDKKELEKLGEIINKQSMMLTDSVRREKEKDYLRKQRDFERKVKDSKTELQIKEAELTNAILQDLIPVVQKYGKDNGYTFIFQNDARILLYTSDALNLTDKVLSIYDAQHQKTGE